ncbi:MAG TPA: ferritin-like domain-containing protein [Nitrososphaera sp.]|jgi:ferritin-like protein
MGGTEKKIFGKNAAKIIEVLKSTYCNEMSIFHYFWYAGINIEGIGLVTFAAALKTRANGELTHAELVADRTSELGDGAPSNPAEWAKYSSIAPLDRGKRPTLRAALKRALQFEGKAVENYNSLAKKAVALSEYVTFNPAATIPADEVKDEQHREDILKLLEVK